MPSIYELIQYLAPAGTRPDPKRPGAQNDPWARPPADAAEDPWGRFPIWPPDLFAIAATLVNQSECYSLSRYADRRFFNMTRHRELGVLAGHFNVPMETSLLAQSGQAFLQRIPEIFRSLNSGNRG